MKELVVLSGKGGTGKTVIAGSFAALARDKVLCDCDVDAPDLHLLLQPAVVEDHEFWGGEVASIDPQTCTRCGLCRDACRFDAITPHYVVDAISCQGCRFCLQICPVGAVQMRQNLAGHWYVSETRHGPLVHARLGAGQENSGKLVTEVRRRARTLAEEQGLNCILSDGPPGIGCPVISSLSGASLALLVTEPTLSAMHDLERVAALCRHFGVAYVVCINKADLEEGNAARIEEGCRCQGIEVVGRISFDPTVSRAIAHGLSPVEYDGGMRQIESLWEAVQSRLEA